jgi:hypothetical protein
MVVKVSLPGEASEMEGIATIEFDSTYEVGKLLQRLGAWEGGNAMLMLQATGISGRISDMTGCIRLQNQEDG